MDASSEKKNATSYLKDSKEVYSKDKAKRFVVAVDKFGQYTFKKSRAVTDSDEVNSTEEGRILDLTEEGNMPDITTITMDDDSDDETESSSLEEPRHLSRYIELDRYSSSNIFGMSSAVQRRVRALKNILVAHKDIDASFHKEVKELELKYADRYAPLHEKRTLIVTGKLNPSEEDCDFPDDDNDNKEDSDKPTSAEESSLSDAGSKAEEDTKGIPEFWKTVLTNIGRLERMIHENDLPVLKHLVDINIVISTENSLNFTIQFHFEPNEFFTNDILTKEYESICCPDKSDPFSFEGPKISKCKGCVIFWNKGKNITVTRIKKESIVQGVKKVVSTTLRNHSFFNFFEPPFIPEDSELMTDDVRRQLRKDFKIGHLMRYHYIPRAVLYFTREAFGGDEYSYEDDDSLDYSSSDDDDDITCGW